jgi:hypothetical protein
MPGHSTGHLISVLLCLGLSTGQAIATDRLEHGETDITRLSNEEISKRLENPLTNLWSITFQENYASFEGDAVNGDRKVNTAFFQPALPVPVGEDLDKIFIARPVIPFVRRPDFTPEGNGGTSGDVAGIGDIQAVALIGPNRVDGVVWGVGATFKFPTAEDDQLGAEKWQAGPAAMLFRFTSRWTVGLLAQHWNSYAGESDRKSTSQTDIQYVVRRSLGNGWSVGMGPTISINWEEDSDNRYTVPVGLGLTKTFRIGKIPFKARIEPQWTLVSPDNFGEQWNIRIQLAPVIQSPFREGIGQR